MNEIRNIKTIQDIYEAFGRGDVAAIAECTSEDTRWSFAAAYDEVPWHAPVEGREALPRFFEALLAHVEFESFEPRATVHRGPDVVVDLTMRYRVRANDRRVEQRQVHWWKLDDAGRVRELCHFEDSAQVLRAVRDSGRK